MWRYISNLHIYWSIFYAKKDIKDRERFENTRGRFFCVAKRWMTIRGLCMFSIINSLNIPSYLFLLLCLMFFEIYGIIQIKKSSRKKEWKNFGYFQAFLSILFAITLGVNRIIHSILPGTQQAKVCAIVTIVLLIINILFFCIMSLILLAKKRW